MPDRREPYTVSVPVQPEAGAPQQPGDPEGRDQVVLRFLALPSDETRTHDRISAGSVLEWIDRAGYAAAVGWSGRYCVTAYVGNVHFTRPIPPGSLVTVHARVVHTGRTSMNVLVTVESADVRRPSFESATSCLLVFVAVDDDVRPTRVPQWEPRTPGQRELSRLVAERIPERRVIKERMAAQRYTDAGTTPRTVFRFLAAPQVANWGGKAHGGTVMRWIQDAAWACAASWSSKRAVGVYSGGIHFHRPIQIGAIVEVAARLIHTGAHSMHVSVHVHSADPRTPEELELTTQCMSVFVVPGDDGRAEEVRPLPLASDEDRRLDAHARELIELRKRMEPLPLDLVGP